MKMIASVILAILLAIVLFCGISWVATGNGWLLAKVFSPRIEQVRRDTFVQSQAYNEGMAQQLEQYEAAYATATPDQRKMLAGSILHQFGGYDTSKLPPDDQAFLEKLHTAQDLGQ